MKTRAVLRRIFDLIDTDMSNDLSKQELLFAFTRSREVRLTLHQLEGLKTMQDPHLFEAAFEAIDVDNDGSASYEELVQFALKSGNDGNLVVMDNEDENEWEVPEEEEVLKINGETVDDKWDELRRKEGALPDHDPMYRPMDYSNDDDNETTGVIYEELHELYEIFDKMVRRVHPFSWDAYCPSHCCCYWWRCRCCCCFLWASFCFFLFVLSPLFVCIDDNDDDDDEILL